MWRCVANSTECAWITETAAIGGGLFAGVLFS